MQGLRSALLWTVLIIGTIGPLALAGLSPLLEWRDLIYILASLTGILAFCLMLVQPIWAMGGSVEIPAKIRRGLHRWGGIGILGLVLAHVGGLWITSPPDVVDALLFRSPTPFTPLGVIGLIAVTLAVCIALGRAKMPPRIWRMGHSALVLIATLASAGHALLIEGTMETVSKILLCFFVLVLTLKAIVDRRMFG